MKFPKRAKILLTALILCAICAPLRAQGIFECGYSVEEIEKFLVWIYSADTGYSLIRQDEEAIVFEREIDPAEVRNRMPKLRLPKRDPRDPYEPVRWRYAPVRRAVERVSATFRLNPQRKSTETRLQNIVLANPDMHDQVVIESDSANFRTLCRYCGTYLDGGYGSGTAAAFYDKHMYVTDVLDGSAAEAAGIETGDRIRSVNGKNADKISLDKFSENYQWAEWGKPFTLDLERHNGERYSVDLVIDYIPAQVERLKEILGTDDILPGASADDVYHEAARYAPKQPKTKAQTQELAQTPMTLPYFALPFDYDEEGNVTSVEPNSVAEAAGMEVGDVIVGYNLSNYSDMTPAQLRESAGKRLARGQTVFLDLMRNGKKISVTLKEPLE